MALGDDLFEFDEKPVNKPVRSFGSLTLAAVVCGLLAVPCGTLFLWCCVGLLLVLVVLVVWEAIKYFK